MQDSVHLRDVCESDLPLFFAHQQDEEVCRMAAFPSREQGAFLAHWTKILAEETITQQTILYEGQVAAV